MTDFELKLIVGCLTGEATDNEQEHLKEWLHEAENRIQYEQIKVIWITSGEIYRTYSPDLTQARKRIQNGIDAPVKMNPWKWIGRAAAILIAVGLGWVITKYRSTGVNDRISMQEISTNAAIATVVLGDGSTVWLNKGTTLKFPDTFTGSERRVFLSGEAFFRITHNAEKPFIVEAGRTETKVLGTSFNIKISEDSVTVAVRTGQVLFSEIDNSKNFQFLAKNEMAAFSYADSDIKKSTVDGSDIPNWRNHPITFKKVALSAVVTSLSIYYNTSIQLDSGISGTLSLTASFDEQSLEEMLQVICVTFDLSLEKTPDGYLIVRNKKQGRK